MNCTLYTAHLFSQHTKQLFEYTIHAAALQTALYIDSHTSLHIVQQTALKTELYTEHKTLNTAQCTLHITLHTLHITLYTVLVPVFGQAGFTNASQIQTPGGRALHCTVDTVLWTLYSVHFTVDTVQCAPLYSGHSILCTAHFTL